MKLKYIGMLLTSLGLATAAAAVPAQQEARPQPTPKPGAAPRDVFFQDAVKSADTDPLVHTPVLIGGDHVSPSEFRYYGNAAFLTGQNGESGKLSAAEATLAHEVVSLRAAIERAKTDSERSDARTKLAENLSKQFDLRQKRHGLEIEVLETQVKKLRELVRKRQDSREDIISRRVDQILREADGLGW